MFCVSDVFRSFTNADQMAVRVAFYVLHVDAWDQGGGDTFVPFDALEDLAPFLAMTVWDNVTSDVAFRGQGNTLAKDAIPSEDNQGSIHFHIEVRKPYSVDVAVVSSDCHGRGRHSLLSLLGAAHMFETIQSSGDYAVCFCRVHGTQCLRQRIVESGKWTKYGLGQMIALQGGGDFRLAVSQLGKTTTTTLLPAHPEAMPPHSDGKCFM